MQTYILKPQIEVCLIFDLISYCTRETYDTKALLEALTLIATGKENIQPATIASTISTTIKLWVLKGEVHLQLSLRSGKSAEKQFNEAIEVYKNIYECSIIQTTDPFKIFQDSVLRIFGKPAIKGNRVFDI